MSNPQKCVYCDKNIASVVANRDKSRKKIHEGLVKLFIAYQSRIDNPMANLEDERTLIIRYQTDIIFKNKIDYLASNAMNIINSYA